MRVFIAIELDENIKEYIFQNQRIVRDNSIKGNFSRKENLHLTLRFIGEANAKQIDDLKKNIDETAKITSSFEIQLGGLGYFPKKNRKIIWLGISKGKKSLQQLFNVLENNLEKHGFGRDERGLNPHITMARQVILNTDFKLLTEKVKIEDIEIPVKKISLMESTRVDGKLTYRPIYTKYL